MCLTAPVTAAGAAYLLFALQVRAIWAAPVLVGTKALQNVLTTVAARLLTLSPARRNARADGLPEAAEKLPPGCSPRLRSGESGAGN
jgi:hypothetical protein